MNLVSVPGLWIVACIVGAVGVAMQVRWVLTRTDVPSARARGMIRAALVEAVGLIGLVLSAPGQTLIWGLVIMMIVGMIVGFVAARALTPPL